MFPEAMMAKGKPGAGETIAHFRRCLLQGKPWFPSLLEAIALWTLPEEEFQGRRYRYLIAGEAFDWRLLAERLCAEADGLLPAPEVGQLLSGGQMPADFSRQDFRRIIGGTKYRAHLSYFYGVVVEEALQGAVAKEVNREKRCNGLREEPGLPEEVFMRIYDSPRAMLWEQFRREREYLPEPGMDPTVHKEFIYWLFKYRLKRCEPARVASDTKKGLAFLHRHHRPGFPF